MTPAAPPGAVTWFGSTPAEISRELFAESARQGWLLVYFNALTALVIGVVQITSGDELFRSYWTFVSRCGASTLASFVLLRLVILQERNPDLWRHGGWMALIAQEVLVLCVTGIAATFFLSNENYTINAQLLVLLSAVGVLSGVLTPRHPAAVLVGRATLFLPAVGYFAVVQPPLWGLLIGLAGFSYVITVLIGGWVYLQSVRTAQTASRLSATMAELRSSADRLATALETETENRVQMQRESDLRERFVHAVTHDLRQTLSALKLHNHSFARHPSPEAERFSRIVSDALGSADATIASVAQAAWIASARTAPQTAEVDLDGFLARIHEETVPMFREAGMKLALVPSSLVVMADAAFLDRVVRNLLHNALNHSTGGKVVLGVRRRGARARIVVADNGPGIAPELQRSIFERYVQGPSRVGRTAGNVGLGLSIVNELAEAMGAKAGLCSRPGHGSVFFVELPTAARRPRPQRGATPASRGEIAVIDDDTLSLSALLAAVQKRGWPARGFASFAEGAQAQADGYIIDYYLDRGHTAQDLLAALGDVAPDRVLIVSTGLTPTLEVSLRRAGYAVSAKPVAPQTLQRFLSSLPKAASS